MKTKPALELSDARRIAAAAQQEALENGWKESVAACDDGGNVTCRAR
ncbi:MAG: heme-binding protein [Rhodocyclaceae bacterium]|nr:heme-binding protein [Rhodocyclaceae bacterium]